MPFLSFNLRSNAHLTSAILKLLDFIIIFALGFFSYFLRFNFFNASQPCFLEHLLSERTYYLGNYTALILATCVLSFIVFNFFKVYEHLRGRSLWHLFQRLLFPWVILVLILGLFSFLTKTGAEYSRLWMVSWLLADFLVLYFYRLILILCFRFLRAKGFNTRNIVIIGSGELAERAIRSIEQHPSMGYVISKVLGPVSLNSQEQLAGKLVEPLPADLSIYLKNLKIDEVWIALPLRKESLIKELMHQLRFSTMTIHLIPDLLGLTLIRQEMFELSGLPVIRIRSTPMQGVNKYLKLLEDRILGGLIFILLMPVMGVIALGIKLSSPGPVLFTQKRYGLDNKEIVVYKFRTMKVHQENSGITQASKADPRVTRFGRFLRRTSLDELPQFYNVLQGRMSIVGPRPHAVAHNELYKDLINSYMLRHMVKPGITGWAQVNGFRGETDTLEKMRSRIEYDLFYIENWSLGFDIKIIFMTLYKGFINKNAY